MRFSTSELQKAAKKWAIDPKRKRSPRFFEPSDDDEPIVDRLEKRVRMLEAQLKEARA